MNSNINKALDYAAQHNDDFLRALSDFLTIETISTDSNHAADMLRGAQWVEERLKHLGAAETRLIETSRHPLVYGFISEAGPDKPTVLVYGHYDVQPPDPLDEWKYKPFSPTIEAGQLYARGASDMKGQMILVFSAIESARSAGGAPVNFKFIIEGQEEIGSPGVREALIENKHLFQSDFVLNLDAGMISKDKPTIVVGLRGLAYFELTLKGFDKDLHSGVFGGVVSNPLNALCQVLAGMKDAHGVIQLPGFYDDVLPLSDDERESLKQLGMDDEYFLEQTGAKELWGEKGFSPVERAGARPTLDVHGIMGGYTGEGPKTVIPAQATAKLSMRLVPRQTPEQVEKQLIAFLEKNVPATMGWELKKFSSEPASLSDRTFYATRCFAQSLEKIFGKPPVYERSGGSIPMVGHLQEVLQLESILSGFSLSEDNIHSPNEKLDLDIFKKGIETVIHFLFDLGEKNGS